MDMLLQKKSYSRKPRQEFANAAEAVGSALARRAERDKSKSSKVNYSNLHLGQLFNSPATPSTRASAASRAQAQGSTNAEELPTESVAADELESVTATPHIAPSLTRPDEVRSSSITVTYLLNTLGSM